MKLTKLNIGTQATSTKAGLKAKIAELTKLIAKVKGQKLITATRNRYWYQSKLNRFGKVSKRKSVASRSKAKRTRK